jgi:hypothetical protein
MKVTGMETYIAASPSVLSLGNRQGNFQLP